MIIEVIHLARMDKELIIFLLNDDKRSKKEEFLTLLKGKSINIQHKENFS